MPIWKLPMPILFARGVKSLVYEFVKRPVVAAPGQCLGIVKQAAKLVPKVANKANREPTF